MIYLDNASTSFPKCPGVKKILSDYLEKGALNINRSTSASSFDLEEKIFDIRESVKRFFNAPKNSHVVFTRGVTESINLFVNGFLNKNDSVLVSPYEHNAVIRPLTENGININIIDQDKCDDNIKCVIINHASNVTGNVYELGNAKRIAQKLRIPLVLDTAQSAGCVKVDMSAIGADFLAFSAHKGLLGLQGAGGAIITEELAKKIKPLIFGGTGSLSSSYNMPDFLPDKFEAGTLNIPGILSLGEGIKFVENYGLENIHSHKKQLIEECIKGLSAISGISVIGDTDKENTGVVSFISSNVDNAVIASLLDNQYGIATRVGLQCAPLAHKTLNTFNIGGTVRVSFSLFNTLSEVEVLLDALTAILKTNQ